MASTCMFFDNNNIYDKKNPLIIFLESVKDQTLCSSSCCKVIYCQCFKKYQSSIYVLLSLELVCHLPLHTKREIGNRRFLHGFCMGFVLMEESKIIHPSLSFMQTSQFYLSSWVYHTSIKTFRPGYKFLS